MASICVTSYAQSIQQASHRLRAAQAARDITAEAIAHHDLSVLLADQGMAQLLASAFLLTGGIVEELLAQDVPRQ